MPSGEFVDRVGQAACLCRLDFTERSCLPRSSSIKVLKLTEYADGAGCRGPREWPPAKLSAATRGAAHARSAPSPSPREGDVVTRVGFFALGAAGEAQQPRV